MLLTFRFFSTAKSSFLLLFLLFFGLPMAVPTATLQANFAPPIEPTRLTMEQKVNNFHQQKKAAFKQQKAQQAPPKANRTIGIFAIIIAGLAIVTIIGYGALFGFLIAAFGGGFAAFALLISISIAVAAVFGIPLIYYGVLAIQNSHKPFSPDAQTNWPRLRREYSWGIFSAILYLVGGGLLMTGTLYVVFIPILALLLLIYLIRAFRRDNPKNKAVETDVFDYEK
jgi:uncharacterized membrane protein